MPHGVWSQRPAEELYQKGSIDMRYHYRSLSDSGITSSHFINSSQRFPKALVISPAAPAPPLVIEPWEIDHGPFSSLSYLL